MKKALLLLAASIVLTFSAACVSAEDYMPESDKYNVVYNVGDENAAGMYGMVAIKGTDGVLDTSNLENIYYIDQASADADGNIKFLDFAPKGAAPSAADFVECTVFIGGPGYDTAESIGVLKKEKSDTPVDPPVDPEEPEEPVVTEYAITGKVISEVGSTAATVAVKDASGADVKTVQATEDGTFSALVPAGEDYSVVITKKSHCSYTITGVDVAAAIALNDADITTLSGDIDSSDDINFYDLKIVLDDYTKKVTDADLINGNADIDESGDINFYDLKIVLNHYNNKAIVIAQ